MTEAQAFLKDLRHIMAEEAARYQLDTLLPNDWTVQRAMEEFKITENQARKILDSMFRRGYFLKVKVANPNGGGARTAYRPVEKKEK
jgi:hypothetical protein